MSDALRPHGLRPTRLLCPWDSPGKNTGVGCHFLLQGNLPDPGMEPGSPAPAGGFFPTDPPGKPFKARGQMRTGPGTLSSCSETGLPHTGSWRCPACSLPLHPPGERPDPHLPPPSSPITHAARGAAPEAGGSPRRYRSKELLCWGRQLCPRPAPCSSALRDEVWATSPQTRSERTAGVHRPRGAQSQTHGGVYAPQGRASP